MPPTVNLIFDEANRGPFRHDSTMVLLKALHAQNIDPEVMIYDDALHQARMGHYPLAIERLRILLVLFPDDKQALKLIGKLYVVTQNITEAEAYFERAKQNGVTIEPALLDIIEEKRNAEAIKERQHQEQLSTMSKQTEQIESLIADIKKLRRDNSILNQEIETLNNDLRKWSSLAAIIAGISVAVSMAFVAHLVFSSPAEQITAEVTTQKTAQISELQPTTKPLPTPDFSGIPQSVVTQQPAGTPVADATNEQNKTVQNNPVSISSPQKQPVADPANAPVSGTETDSSNAPPDFEFPMEYTIKSGDSPGRIAEKYYGRASLGRWLAKQNNTAPNKLRVGQVITLPTPPE